MIKVGENNVTEFETLEQAGSFFNQEVKCSLPTTVFYALAAIEICAKFRGEPHISAEYYHQLGPRAKSSAICLATHTACWTSSESYE